MYQGLYLRVDTSIVVSLRYKWESKVGPADCISGVVLYQRTNIQADIQERIQTKDARWIRKSS